MKTENRLDQLTNPEAAPYINALWQRGFANNADDCSDHPVLTGLGDYQQVLQLLELRYPGEVFFALNRLSELDSVESVASQCSAIWKEQDWKDCPLNLEKNPGDVNILFSFYQQQIRVNENGSDFHLHGPFHGPDKSGLWQSHLQNVNQLRQELAAGELRLDERYIPAFQIFNLLFGHDFSNSKTDNAREQRITSQLERQRDLLRQTVLNQFERNPKSLDKAWHGLLGQASFVKEVLDLANCFGGLVKFRQGRERQEHELEDSWEGRLGAIAFGAVVAAEAVTLATSQPDSADLALKVGQVFQDQVRTIGLVFLGEEVDLLNTPLNQEKTIQFIWALRDARENNLDISEEHLTLVLAQMLLPEASEEDLKEFLKGLEIKDQQLNRALVLAASAVVQSRPEQLTSSGLFGDEREIMLQADRLNQQGFYFIRRDDTREHNSDYFHAALEGRIDPETGLLDVRAMECAGCGYGTAQSLQEATSQMERLSIQVAQALQQRGERAFYPIIILGLVVICGLGGVWYWYKKK